MGHSRRTLWSDTVVLQVYKTSASYETSSQSHASSLQNEHFARDFFQKYCNSSSSPKCALRTRLPQKLTLEVCKTSVSDETSSKSHASSLQDNRFVRDFLQKSRVESPKRAFRTRLPPKLTCQSLQNEHLVRDFFQKSGKPHQSTDTHQAPLPSSFAIPAPPNNARSHANPNVTATFTTTTCNLTTPCACHETFRIHTSNAKRPEGSFDATPETQIPMAQPHPTPQKHHSPNANPNVTARISQNITTRFLAISHESDTSRFHAKPSPKPSPNGSGLSVLMRTAANGCGRLRTVANAETTGREQGYPQTPRVKREPFGKKA